MLQISKALCKQIMDPTYISRLVAAPGAEIQVNLYSILTKQC